MYMLEYRSTSILLKYIENEVQVQVQVCTSTSTYNVQRMYQYQYQYHNYSQLHDYKKLELTTEKDREFTAN